MARLVLVDEDEPTKGARLVLVEEQKQDPFIVRAGRAINDIPRQLGLTARYALEGPAQAMQVFTEPIRAVQDRILPWKSQPLANSVSQVLDRIGLPKPENPTERVVGDAARTLAGSAATIGAGSLGSALPGITGTVMSGIAANPAQQLSGAVGAGMAGGASREAGGNDLMQLGAGLLGGVAGSMAPGAVNAVASRVQGMRLSPQDIDLRIGAALGRSGVDYSQLPQHVRNQMRAELADAIRAGGELDPAAVARLADFRLVGATPTRGMVTQNPVQITREQNLAKIAANSQDDSLHGLPLIQNQNNATFIRSLNDAGAVEGSAFAAGERTLAAIRGRDEAMRQGVNAAYDQARGMFGRDVPLDRQSVIGSIWDAVNAEYKGAFFPKEIRDTLNRISSGKEPFTVGVLDNIETMLATAGRSAQDGNTRRAIQLAREAIVNAPLAPVKSQFGNGQVVTGAMGNAMQAFDDAPAGVMDALRQARSAARERFNWQEATKPVSAAVNGAEPDRFFKRFVVDGDAADVRSVMQNGDPEAIRAATLDYLKRQAINGAADEVGKFSQSAYNKALSNLGDAKLKEIFDSEQIQQLKALGRVSSYAMVQPVGSAVNNSNSGALVLGRGYDWLRGFSEKVPVLGPMLSGPMRNIDVSLAQRQARNVIPGLLAEDEFAPLGARLIAPGFAITGGLLSAP